MTNSHEPGDGSAGPPSGTRRLRWWVAGITFVVGFVFGVIAVGLLNASKPDFGAKPGGGTAANSSIAPTPGGGVPVVAEARVNAACLAVINEAQDTYTVLTGVKQAAADVDLQQLDDIVRQLQPIQTRLGRDLQACRVETGIETNPSASAAPQTTTPTPTSNTTR